MCLRSAPFAERGSGKLDPLLLSLPLLQVITQSYQRCSEEHSHIVLPMLSSGVEHEVKNQHDPSDQYQIRTPIMLVGHLMNHPNH